VGKQHSKQLALPSQGWSGNFPSGRRWTVTRVSRYLLMPLLLDIDIHNDISALRRTMLRSVMELIPRLALLTAFLSALGCGAVQEVQKSATNAAQRQALMNHVRAVGAANLRFSDSHGGRSAPKSWEDLASAGLPGDTRQALEAAGYKVVIGVPLADATIGTSNFMQSFPANPSGDQILVGMMDGSGMVFTRADFDQRLAEMQPFLATGTVLEPPAAAVPAGAPVTGPIPPPPPASGS
jgi:hypothetical protein